MTPDNLLRILFIVPYPPSLIRVRAFNLIRELTSLGHQVTVLTLYSDAAEQADAASLMAHCHQVISYPLPRWRSVGNCLKVLPTQKPLQAAYCWQPALASRLRELIRPPANSTLSFDVVHIEHLRAAEYGLYLKKLFNSGGYSMPIIWDSVDCISHLFRQAARTSHSRFGSWASRLDLSRTERYEGRLPNQFDHTLIVSEIDRQALLELVPARSAAPEISIIPNGVHLDYFYPDATTREPDTLIFSGKMSYHANVTMALFLAQEIMPRVWRQRPSVKLNIVGKAPPKEITALAQNPNIVVTGLVPDLRPYIRGAAAAVVPLIYGAGTQFKVLEAMACATPVVTTPQAAAPLSAVPGRDLLTAGDAEEFGRVILQLLADSEMQKRVGACGRQYVEKHHNWATITTKLVEIYTNVFNQSPVSKN